MDMMEEKRKTTIVINDKMTADEMHKLVTDAIPPKKAKGKRGRPKGSFKNKTPEDIERLKERTKQSKRQWAKRNREILYEKHKKWRAMDRAKKNDIEILNE